MDNAHESASSIAVGPAREVDPEVLRRRLPASQRAANLAAAAEAAWAAALARSKDDLIEPFPARNPVSGNIAALTGKLVYLGPLRAQDWVREVMTLILVAGDAERGYYFLKDNDPPTARMVGALARFRQRVSPEIPETYQILGRVTGQPDLRVVDGRARFGLAVEPLCALIGGCLFVDLTAEDAGRSLFLGEQALPAPPCLAPPADAAPEVVARAVVQAIHHQAKAEFGALLATEQLRSFGNGQPDYRHYYNPNVNGEWDKACALLAADVVDIIPLAAGPVRRMMERRELAPGLFMPSLDQVEVEVEYIGHFQGAHHAFRRDGLPAKWLLQRKDQEPWRLFLPHQE